MNTCRYLLIALLALQALLLHIGYQSPLLTGWFVAAVTLVPLAAGMSPVWRHLGIGATAAVLCVGTCWFLLRMEGDLIIAVTGATHAWALGICWGLAHYNQDRKGEQKPTEGRVMAAYIAFLGSLILCYHLFHRAPGLPHWLSVLMGIIVLLLSLGLWEAGWFTLRRKVTPNRVQWDHWLLRCIVVLFLTSLLSLIFISGRNALTDPVIHLVQPIKEKLEKKQEEDTARKADTDPDGDASGTMKARDRHELPGKADLQLGNEATAYLRFEKGNIGQWTNQTVYLRRYALDAYNGRQWNPVPTRLWYEDHQDGNVDGWVRFPSVHDSEALVYSVYLPSHLGEALPVVPGERGFQLGSVFEHAPAWYRSEVTGKVRYTAESAPRMLEELGPDIAPGTTPRSEQSDATYLSRAVRELAVRILEDAGNDAQSLAAIRTYLQENCRYDLKIENPDDHPPLENFLLFERRGYCDFFATAAALMARVAGFPSRICYGYSGGNRVKDHDVLVFSEKDTHAWAEVYVEKAGWVIFETTPSNGPATPPTREDGQLPDFNEFTDLDENPVERSLWGRFMTWLGSPWAIAVFASGFLATLALMYWRNTHEESSSDKTSANKRKRAPLPPYLKALHQFCLEAGHSVDPGETLRETLDWMQVEGISDNRLSDLSRYHYRVRYHGEDRDKQRERQLLQNVKDCATEWRTETKE